MSGTLTNESSWHPDESPFVLFQERAALEGTITSGVLYGILFVIYCMCFDILINQKKRDRRTWLFLAYINIQFTMGTLYFISSARSTQLTYIDDRNYPGGPAQFEIDMFAIPINVLGTVALVMGNWFADALMLWRCMVVWSDSRFRWWVVFPLLMYLASFGLSIIFLDITSSPGLSIWSSNATAFTIAYFTLSLSSNVIMTISIVIRLFLYRVRVIRSLGKQYASQYTSIAAIIVESAFIYAAFSLFFLIPYALNNPIQDVSLQLLAFAELIAPLLVIYRVGKGQAFSTEQASRITAAPSMTFRKGQTSHITSTPTMFSSNVAVSFPDSNATYVSSEDLAKAV